MRDVKALYPQRTSDNLDYVTSREKRWLSVDAIGLGGGAPVGILRWGSIFEWFVGDPGIPWRGGSFVLGHSVGPPGRFSGIMAGLVGSTSVGVDAGRGDRRGRRPWFGCSSLVLRRCDRRRRAGTLTSSGEAAAGDVLVGRRPRSLWSAGLPAVAVRCGWARPCEALSRHPGERRVDGRPTPGLQTARPRALHVVALRRRTSTIRRDGLGE